MWETLKRLLLEIKPYKSKVIIIASMGILYSLFYSRLVLSLKDINDSFEKGNQQQIVTISLISVGLALGVGICRYFHIFEMNFVSELVVNNLRQRLQRKLMDLHMGFHSAFENGAGGLMSRVLNDVKVIQDGLRMVADLFREPLLGILLLGNLFYLNWKLTCSMMIVLPFILVFLRWISLGLRKFVQLGQEQLEKMTSTIKETLDGVRIIQSFNLQNMMGEKLRNQSDDYVQIRKSVHQKVELMGPVTEFIATCLILSIFVYFSVQVGRGEVSSGSVLAYIASLMLLNQPIKKLQESYVRIQETLVAARRVYEILDMPVDIQESLNPKPFPKEWKMIRYENVNFTYGKLPALKNISFTISRGEKVAFVGESGSGKSTLVNLLLRFYNTTSGDIFIDDISIRDFAIEDLRNNIALVAQDVFLFSDTIEKNIWSGNFSRDPKLTKEAAEAVNAHEFVKRLPNGYQNMVGERGGMLSGGEKQRISIARALFKNAPILVLDEATSALDHVNEEEVQRGIETLMAGRTCFIIAHRPRALRAADKIIVIKNGVIVETGNSPDLLSLRGEFARLQKVLD